jgi:hypothetical protein
MMDEISKGTTQARIDSLFHFDRKFARVGSKRLASAIQLHTAPASPSVKDAKSTTKGAKKKGAKDAKASGAKASGAKAKASTADSAAAAAGAQPVEADDSEAKDGTAPQQPAGRKRMRKAAQTTGAAAAGSGRKRRAPAMNADAPLALVEGAPEEDAADGELCD